jgi:transposase, IS30 family
LPYGAAQMGTKYSHLTDADRVLIEAMHRAGRSGRCIAQAVGVHPSTISREISRSRTVVFGYTAYTAQRRAVRLRREASLARRKLGADLRSPRWRTVLDGLRSGWSPQQIAGRLKASGSHMQALSMSHETIYCAIYAMPRGTLRSDLISMLRKHHKVRMPRTRGQARCQAVQDITPIALRPPEVAARIVPGHWEGDLIKGPANRSAVGTLIERTSRFLMLVKLDGSSAQDTLNGFSRRLRKVPPSLRRTLTYDQSSEMALHRTLAERLRIDIYFCDPRSPWQRGTNENANGLVREYLPKGVDLSQFSHQQLSSIEQSLNTRPRKILGFRTPEEVFNDLKFDHIAGVALEL